MNALTIAGARKTFGRTVALDGASFELRAGELLALLGPNGAGKTTVIRAIAGRVRLDAGDVRLFDRVLDGRRNGWALDGYLKVFWRNAALWEFWPQVVVLTIAALVFMSAARLFARRWETA